MNKSRQIFDDNSLLIFDDEQSIYICPHCDSFNKYITIRLYHCSNLKYQLTYTFKGKCSKCKNTSEIEIDVRISSTGNCNRYIVKEHKYSFTIDFNNKMLMKNILKNNILLSKLIRNTHSTEKIMYLQKGHLTTKSIPINNFIVNEILKFIEDILPKSKITLISHLRENFQIPSELIVIIFRIMLEKKFGNELIGIIDFVY